MGPGDVEKEGKKKKNGSRAPFWLAAAPSAGDGGGGGEEGGDGFVVAVFLKQRIAAGAYWRYRRAFSTAQGAKKGPILLCAK